VIISETKSPPTVLAAQAAKRRVRNPRHRSENDGNVGFDRADSHPMLRQSLRQVALKTVERDPLLRHRVAFANRDGFVFERVEVDRDGEWRSDFVLATVSASDRTGVIKVNVPVLSKVFGEFTRQRREFLVARQREDRLL